MGFSKFGDKISICFESWSRMLAPGKSMKADLHAPRLPYVLLISFFTAHFCLQCFASLPSAVFSYEPAASLRRCIKNVCFLVFRPLCTSWLPSPKT